MKGRAGREQAVMAVVFADLVGDDDQPLDALGLDLSRDLRHAGLAVHRLAAGHRNRVVIEDLVGDVRLRRDGLADGEIPRVVVGAVAQVLEDMPLLREARVRRPVHTLGAHLDQPRRAALHPARHEVAADAGQRARALGQLGGGVVRAARAEVGLAAHAVGGVAQQAGRQEVDNEVAAVQCGVEPRQPVGHRAHDAAGAQLAQGAQYRRAVLVRLADDARALELGQVVEQLLDLALHHRALFLDDQHVGQVAAELDDARRLQREHEADLVDPYTRCGQRVGVQVQPAQHLHEVVVRLADRDDAQRGCRAGDDVFVDAVDLGESLYRVELVRQP